MVSSSGVQRTSSNAPHSMVLTFTQLSAEASLISSVCACVRVCVCACVRVCVCTYVRACYLLNMLMYMSVLTV